MENDVLFSSNRMLVRKLSIGDLVDFHRLQSDPRVFEFTGGKPNGDLNTNRKELLSLIGAYDEFPGRWILAVIVKESQYFVGTCALYVNPEGLYEIGYRFIPEYWGKGYASEVLPALIRFCFSLPGINQVCAYVFSDHFASLRVIEKAGMKLNSEFFNVEYDRMDRKYAIERSKI